jgi:hypothetical protein
MGLGRHWWAASDRTRRRLLKCLTRAPHLPPCTPPAARQALARPPCSSASLKTPAACGWVPARPHQGLGSGAACLARPRAGRPSRRAAALLHACGAEALKVRAAQSPPPPPPPPTPTPQVAVIVNDMAELNIDASLVRGAGLVQAKESLVQLQVGGGVGVCGWRCARAPWAAPARPGPAPDEAAAEPSCHRPATSPLPCSRHAPGSHVAPTPHPRAPQNGCICCTLRGDLLQEVAALAARRAFDYLVIESTGEAGVLGWLLNQALHCGPQFNPQT